MASPISCNVSLKELNLWLTASKGTTPIKYTSATRFQVIQHKLLSGEFHEGTKLGKQLLHKK